MKLLDGVVHKTPLDVQKLITQKHDRELWNNLTLLGRNEFLCWITSAKKQETRERRIQRTIEDIQKGKRRPCCFAGCPHRKTSL